MLKTLTKINEYENFHHEDCDYCYKILGAHLTEENGIKRIIK